MITTESVKNYLGRMFGTRLFDELETNDQEKVIFSAIELLKTHFKVGVLTDRAVALQVLYMVEGEEEEYATLKRQGVKSFSTKGISISFEGDNISPDVIKLLRPASGSVGRLI